MVKRNRAVKVRLYPTEQQQKLLNKTFGCVRKVYNLALEECINSYQQTGLFTHRRYNDYMQEYPYLAEVEKQALQQSLINLKAAFKNRFSKTAKRKTGFPKFKSKRSKQSYRTCMPSATALESKTLKLPKIGKVKYRGKPRVSSDWKLKSITVSKSASGKYYASLLYEFYVEEPKPVLDLENSLGLDYSSPNFYVDNQGIKANYPKFFRKYEAKLAFEQRKLSRMKKFSSNWNKQRIKVARVYEKISHCRKDFCDKLSRKLADIYDFIFVEDINIQNMSQSLHLGKATMDNSFGMFRGMLAYKLEELGKHLIKIDKWTPTTTVCHVCGAYHKDIVNGLHVRTWTCPDCNTFHDRDINAAINIRNIGILTAGTVGLAR